MYVTNPANQAAGYVAVKVGNVNANGQPLPSILGTRNKSPSPFMMGFNSPAKL